MLQGRLAGLGRVGRRFVLALVLTGCVMADAQPVDTPNFAERASRDVQSQDGVTVGVEILTPDEIKAEFELPLLHHDIWPVWVTVENATASRLLFSPVEFDPDHFSPGEIAWRTKWASSRSFEAERADMDRRQFPLLIESGTKASGFVYVDLTRGVRFFTVALYSQSENYRFPFAEVAPGFKADFLEIDVDEVYRDHKITELSLDRLRGYIETLPATTLGPDQITSGDPLNIAFVGDGAKILMAFGERDWDITETKSTTSALRTIGSSLFGRHYRTSPVSPLYLFGRRQDFALQKSRRTVDERNHLRLWLAPVRLRGRPVWVGQVSRDIGVKLIEKNFITHKVDPDIDEARNYVLFDLMLTGWFPQYVFVAGVGKVSPDDPRYNYTEDPYFTNGFRLVLFHAGDSERTDDLEMLDWERPLARLSDSTELQR
jgi:hypothetical protein